MTPAVEDAFRLAVEALDRSGASYAAIGALARAAWGRPRATTDVDFAIVCNPAALARVRDELNAGGFEPVREVRSATPREEPPELWIWRSGAGVRLDLLVAHTPFEREALTRRRRVRVGLIETWVVTPEDLIVYKLIAGRPRDLDDVADVASAADPIDWTYVERWAQAWGVLDRLDRLRGQAG